MHYCLLEYLLHTGNENHQFDNYQKKKQTMNMQEEIRDGYTISSDMKKLWAIQIQMVKHVLEVCKKHDLRIWADGGTLLGTVRHKGYIPWDDDIDLFMPRKDYDKLCSLADTEFKAPYFFQCFRTEKNYFRGHAQLRHDNTAAILREDIFMDLHQGIFIDIFCYDNVPDKIDEEYLRKLRFALLAKQYLNFRVYLSKVRRLIYYFEHPDYLFSIIWIIVKSRVVGKSRIYEQMEDSFRVYSQKDTIYNNCPCFFVTDYHLTLRKNSWLRETFYLPFEDISMPVPNGYKEILSTLYGEDYMTPKVAPSMHGGYVAFSSEVSYQELVRELRKQRPSLIKRITKRLKDRL